MSPVDLLHLPNELFLVLEGFLSTASINALVRTCRLLFDMFDHRLYLLNARQGDSSALKWAVHEGLLGTTKKALAAGADVNSRRPSGQSKRGPEGSIYATTLMDDIPYTTPLTMAVDAGKLEIATLLIAAGAEVDINPRENGGGAPLLSAVGRDDLDMVKLLLSSGCIDLISPLRYGINILTIAVQNSCLQLIPYILDNVQEADLHRPMGTSPLSIAVQTSRSDVVQLLLDSLKINHTLADDTGRTALSWAATVEVAIGHEDILQLLIGSGKFDLNSIDRHGRSPIALAAEAGNHDSVALLLATPGVDPNLLDNNGLSPILLALQHGQVEAVMILMASDKVITPIDALFRLACERASTDITRALLKLYEPGEFTGANGSTWLHVAASYGRTDVVKALLRNDDVSINEQMLDGSTALICAVKEKRRATITALLQAGADVSIITSEGWSVLCYACQSNNVGLVEELLRRGCDITASTFTGETALHLACVHGDVSIVRVLLENGADPLLRSNNGKTALHAACASRWEQTVALLLEYIPHAHPILQTGRTPLHDACTAGHTGITALLLNHGADPLAELENGTTPLEMACQGLPFIAKMLLEKGADPLKRTSDGNTLLHKACLNSTPKVATLLLQYGADPNVADNDSTTPLHIACSGTSQMLVRTLLKHGADVTATKLDGSTPLHEACRSRYVIDQTVVVQKLVEKGANVNARLQNGQTPLHLACIAHSEHLPPVLLGCGADLLAEFTEPTTGRCITLLHLLCRWVRGASPIPLLSQLLGQVDPAASHIWDSNWTPLHEAAAVLNSKAVKLLLEHGANPMAQTENGNTALHLIFLHARFDPVEIRKATEIIAVLLDTSQIEVNHRNAAGKTALGEGSDVPEELRTVLRRRGCLE